MEWKSGALDCAKKIKCVIFDVDGVLTEGSICTGEDRELFKPFFCRDGLGITLAHKAGLKTAIITGRRSPVTAQRARELSIDEVYQGSLDKRAAYRDLKAKLSLQDEEFAYIGDDLIDLPIMVQVGLPAAVGDAVPEVKAKAQVVSGFPGGRGAAREILEFILKSQGLWEGIVAGFLQPDDTKGLAQ